MHSSTTLRGSSPPAAARWTSESYACQRSNVSGVMVGLAQRWSRKARTSWLLMPVPPNHRSAARSPAASRALTEREAKVGALRVTGRSSDTFMVDTRYDRNCRDGCAWCAEETASGSRLQVGAFSAVREV